MTRDRRTAFFGLGASIVFFLALAVFGLLDPAYSHGTKAVSELGAVGAEHQLAWNLIGFGAVGLLLAAFGWRFGARLEDLATRWLLTLFGLAFAATAIPADMDDLRSAGSTAHIGASIAVLLFWALALLRLLWIGDRLRGLKLASGLALALALGSIAVRASEVVLPGLAQRMSFLVMFGWVVAASLLLLKQRHAPAAATAP